MAPGKRNFDIIIFGATSYTGKWLLLEIVKRIQSDGDSFTWAIAGRSPSKMDALLNQLSRETGEDLSKIRKITADVSMPSSIVEMAKESRLVLNLAGPYVTLGEEVVHACAQEGTHYIDLSGEPLFLYKMEEKYNQMAEQSGSYIVASCGVGALPSDLGAAYLADNFDGQLNSIESLLELGDEFGNVTFSNLKCHYGTYHSMLLLLHQIRELLGYKKKMAESIGQREYPLETSVLKYRKEVNGWALSELPIGEIMAMSQFYAKTKLNRKPVQTSSHTVFSTLFPALVMMFVGVFVTVLVQFKLGLKILLMFPKFFSCGMISHEGPSKEESDKINFTFTLIGKGWPKESDHHDTPPNKVQTLKVRGVSPGYGATSIIMLEAAITILHEADRMPKNGGVYTPGPTFSKTTLVQRLNRAGITFTMR